MALSAEPWCHGFPANPGTSLLDAFPKRPISSASGPIASLPGPPESFHRLIDDPTAAEAICERITAGALVVSLPGRGTHWSSRPSRSRVPESTTCRCDGP